MQLRRSLLSFGKQVRRLEQNSRITYLPGTGRCWYQRNSSLGGEVSTTCACMLRRTTTRHHGGTDPKRKEVLKEERKEQSSCHFQKQPRNLNEKHEPLVGSWLAWSTMGTSSTWHRQAQSGCRCSPASIWQVSTAGATAAENTMTRSDGHQAT